VTRAVADDLPGAFFDRGAFPGTLVEVEHLRIGYARCSSVPEDLDREREALAAAGVAADRIYLDVGLSGITRARPALGEAMAACWAGSMLVVTGLDRLARSVPDARDMVTTLADRHVTLVIGESVYDASEPLGAQLGAVLAVVADFEAALVRGRTVEGMRIARVKGRLKGRSPKLTPAREEHVVQLYEAGEYTTSEIGELLRISRSTVYRAVKRAAKAKLAETS